MIPPLRWKPGWAGSPNSTKILLQKQSLRTQKANGVERKLVGFEMVEKGIPRHGYEIKDFSGMTIGVVTSGTQSPSLGKGIGMGYVRTVFSKLDSEDLY